MTLTMTLKLKKDFWTLLPPGAYRSVSQTHLDVWYKKSHFLISNFFFDIMKSIKFLDIKIWIFYIKKCNFFLLYKNDFLISINTELIVKLSIVHYIYSYSALTLLRIYNFSMYIWIQIKCNFPCIWYVPYFYSERALKTHANN